MDQKLTVLSMFSIQENILTRLFKVSHLIHHSIRPDATDFQSRSFEIWHTSAFSLCFPSIKNGFLMATRSTEHISNEASAKSRWIS